MAQNDSDLGPLSEDEKRLVAFFRSQPPRVKELLLNITVFEQGIISSESAEPVSGCRNCSKGD